MEHRDKIFFALFALLAPNPVLACAPDPADTFWHLTLTLSFYLFLFFLILFIVSKFNSKIKNFKKYFFIGLIILAPLFVTKIIDVTANYNYKTSREKAYNECRNDPNRNALECMSFTIENSGYGCDNSSPSLNIIKKIFK